MIELTCTKCKTVLSIDDAFAGGVCRCKHCGTIQTVPKQTKRSAIPASVAANGRPDTVGQATGSGTGLDELAHVVASSGLGTGLGESRLRKAPPDVAVAAPAGTAGVKRETVLILSVGGTIVVLLGIIIAILLGGRGKGADEGRAKRSVPVVQTPTGTQRTAAHFLGVPIQSSSVVYVLDRGSGTSDVFDQMRVALQSSMATLPPTTQFQVVFWETDTVVALPTSVMQPATPENVQVVHDGVVNVAAYGQSKVEPALGKALSQNPSDVILATGKSGLDESFVKSVVGLRGGKAVRIHTFSLGNGSPEALRSIAQQTGGEFREVGFAELREFAK